LLKQGTTTANPHPYPDPNAIPKPNIIWDAKPVEASMRRGAKTDKSPN